MTALFDEVRVLDFTHGFAGPYCGRAMADMGADVIKIEPPRGDLTRGFPYVIGPSESGFFTQVNAGKKSIVVDLKQAEGIDIVYQLVRRSDVVLENFSPGVMERLGIGYAELSHHNNALVMASVSCFGQTGPYASRPGAEIVAQGYGGIMEVTGDPAGPPTLVGAAVSDLAAGTHALAGVGAALFHRERTGQGQHVDVALLDCILQSQIQMFQEYFLSGGRIRQTRTGASSPSLVPLGIFRAKNGYLTFAAVDQPRWLRLCEALDHSDAAEEPRFRTPQARRSNYGELHGELESWIQERTVDEVLTRLVQAHLPCAPVLGVEDIIRDPHVVARGTFSDVDHGSAGAIPVLNTPLRFSESPTAIRGRAPFLGEHTREVLADALGLPKATVRRLERNGVISQHKSARAQTTSDRRSSTTR